jgi:hypothetical protein
MHLVSVTVAFRLQQIKAMDAIVSPTEESFEMQAVRALPVRHLGTPLV